MGQYFLIGILKQPPNTVLYTPTQALGNIYIYIYIYIGWLYSTAVQYIYIHIYIYNLWDIWGLYLKHSIYRLVSPGGYSKVEEFKDLSVFANYIYNWKIWAPMNDVLK